MVVDEALKQTILVHHFPFEVSMLRDTFERLQHGPLEQQLANALIESFALHARNLIDFFCDTPSERKAIAARHFTTGYTPFEGRRIKSSDEYAKINDQVAHLGYGRTTDAKRKFNLADRRTVAGWIETEIPVFLRHLLPNYQEAWDRADGAGMMVWKSKR